MKVRLVHVNSEQALRYSGKVYPDWGFYQNEVVCDKNIVQLDTVWNVEEHRYTKSKSFLSDTYKNSMQPLTIYDNRSHLIQIFTRHNIFFRWRRQENSWKRNLRRWNDTRSSNLLNVLGEISWTSNQNAHYKSGKCTKPQLCFRSFRMAFFDERNCLFYI